MVLGPGESVSITNESLGTRAAIYVDGRERGTMDRPGPVQPNDFHLCLGNYEVGHVAHFEGLLDEVKLYSRALTAEEVQERYRRLANRG